MRVGPVGPAASAAAEGAADWAKSTPGVASGLANAARALFRGGAQEVAGGTAGAIRKELATPGKLLEASSILRKARPKLIGLQTY